MVINQKYKVKFKIQCYKLKNNSKSTYNKWKVE